MKKFKIKENKAQSPNQSAQKSQKRQSKYVVLRFAEKEFLTKIVIFAISQFQLWRLH